MKSILVTGGAGFIGSNFVHYVLNNLEYRVVNLDALTYAGNLDNLKDVRNSTIYRFVEGNICNRALLEQLFQEEDFTYVVNFAAESHVDRSIQTPEIFMETNVLGTQILLDVAMKYWKTDKSNYGNRCFKEGIKFIQISTDEVYGALGPNGSFTEAMPLQPNSPYSASKAAADLLVRAYYQTYGLPVNITRCSNNYGAYQYPEKLIPLMIHNALNDIPLPLYGDGMQIRDWLFVEDHCSAIATVMENGISGEVYNIGGNNEKTNLDIIIKILETLGKNQSLITYVADRPGHDRRYAIDNTKIMTELGWSPNISFEEGIEKTIQWYVDNQGWVKNIIEKND